jgi:hypothetical protein
MVLDHHTSSDTMDDTNYASDEISFRYMLRESTSHDHVQDNGNAHSAVFDSTTYSMPPSFDEASGSNPSGSLGIPGFPQEDITRFTKPDLPPWNVLGGEDSFSSIISQGFETPDYSLPQFQLNYRSPPQLSDCGTQAHNDSGYGSRLTQSARSIESASVVHAGDQIQDTHMSDQMIGINLGEPTSFSASPQKSLYCGLCKKNFPTQASFK